jgi:pimeloyl-ACP methyl ester carboxylesterase
MDRRNVLKSAVLSTAGAMILPPRVEAQATPVHSSKAERRTVIEATDGTPLYYEDWGNGQPVLFLHGAGSNWEQWNYNMLTLSHQLRCIAYDRRGHGRSSDFGQGFDYDILAEDLAEVIKQLNLTRLVVIAHSMGGGEIVRYLSRYGAGRIARIVLVGPTLPFILKTPDNPDGVDEEAFSALRAQWAKDYPRWIAENARPFFMPETSEAMVQWGCSLMMHTPLKTVINCNHIISQTDFRRELVRITVPTLIIHGDKDVSAQIDFTGRRTAALIHGSEFKVYEGAAHGLFITHAERFNHDVLQFITA